jgi:VanZ family protein
VLSLTPLDELPVPTNDKLLHLLAYTALTIPLILTKPKYWWLIVIFFLAYSGLIEIIQPYVNRYSEWLDMAANCAGIAFGIIIAKLFSFIFPVKLQLPDS